ncbi:MAG: glycoside hydrolase family 38 C-terminal domain-containing protein, partial [Cyanobacteria bacterium J06659_2]
RYTREAFGHISRIAWLPDTFGFCWQLPQMLTLGGIDYFATQKLRWNDSNTFPHDLFEWRSPDGTTIRSVTLPPIGSDIDPVKMADYACQWETNTGCLECLWLPGAGDHGGGPTRDMLMVAQRWDRSPFFPRLCFTTAEPLLDQLTTPPSSELSTPALPDTSITSSSPNSSNPSPLPTWNDELYLELHRGCYTTHAEQKHWNRRCERLLYQAELFSSIASLLTEAEYPHDELEQAWKKVLFNQFHDILPGSSIPEVYKDANPLWKQAETFAEQVLDRALRAIAQQIPFPSENSFTSNHHPFVVFNSLSWERSEVVAIAIPYAPDPEQTWTIRDSDGNIQSTQIVTEQCPHDASVQHSDHLIFLATHVPGVGYRSFSLEQVPLSNQPSKVDLNPIPASATNLWELENEYFRVVINPNTGAIDQLYDRASQTPVFSADGNQLQFFRDAGQYWDAWNIAPDYADQRLSDAALVSMDWIENGPVQQRLRVTHSFGQSIIQQDYVLQTQSPLLRVESIVDWHEDYTLLKVAFPVNFNATTATYDMPCGAIERSPTPTTPEERAKWEVPALNWADLSTEETDNSAYGVSILSDYKHGYDATDAHLRLTLLKSPKWPDPNADRGRHYFAYGIYPHTGSWRAAKTTQLG